MFFFYTFMTFVTTLILFLGWVKFQKISVHNEKLDNLGIIFTLFFLASLLWPITLPAGLLFAVSVFLGRLISR